MAPSKSCPETSAICTALFGKRVSNKCTHELYGTPRDSCPIALLYCPIKFTVVWYSTDDVQLPYGPIINVQLPQLPCTWSWDSCSLSAIKFLSSVQKLFLPLFLFLSLAFSFSLNLLLRNEECLLVSLFPLLSSLSDFWVSL